MTVGIVPAGCVGVSVRLEGEEREERRRPDRQAAPDEDLDGRIARCDASGQVARLGAWLPKPLTRAHNGRIIRAWSSGTSRLRRRTRRSAEVRPLTEELVGAPARARRAPGAAVGADDADCGQRRKRRAARARGGAGAARRGGRRHRPVCRADPRGGRTGEGPGRRPRRLPRDPRRARTCCSAGAWARTRSASGTAWTRASRAASLSSRR